MKLAAVTFTQHAQMALSQNKSFYTFAAQDSLIPVVAAELPKLVPMIPLAFLPNESGYLLMAVASLLPGQNLYIAPTTGQWMGNYVPASLRAYPFRMVKPVDADQAVLCVIEDSGLLVPRGQGSDFFTEDGKPTQAIQDIVDFLSQIERNRVLTQLAVDALAEAGLLQPWALQTEKDGAMVPVNGLFCINEAALNALDAATLHALREKGALALAYAQLFSMNQLEMLEKLKPAQEQLKQQAAAKARPQPADLDLEFLNRGGTLNFGNLGN